MYSNSYQNCSFIELYNSQKKESKRQWKTSGPVLVEFDPVLKGYVLSLINGGVSKFLMPKSEKILLGIVQPCIVFQIYIYSIKSLAIEVSFTDASKIHRRFLFSSAIKEITINPLHCKVPIPYSVPIGKWINISIDVSSFNNECFKNQTFRSIDMVSLTGNCRIRKVFSMKFPFQESGLDSKNVLLKSNNSNNELDAEVINKFLGLPNEVPYENIIISYDKIKSLFTHLNDNRGSSPKGLKKNSDLLSNNFIDGNVNSPYLKQSNLNRNSPLIDKISNPLPVNKGALSTNSKILMSKNRMINILSKKSDPNLLVANELNSIKSKSKSPDKNKRFSPKKANNSNKNDTIQNLAKHFIVGSMINSSLKKTRLEPLNKNKNNINSVSKKEEDSTSYILPKLSLSEKKALDNNSSLGVENIKEKEYVKDDKEDENYYKFDEKDFSTHNSQEDDYNNKEIFQKETDDKEDCIDEHISVVSEDSNEKNEENTNKYEPQIELKGKENAQMNSINWNFPKENLNNQLKYVNVFGNRQNTSIFTPPFSKYTSSKIKMNKMDIPETNEFDYSSKNSIKKARMLTNKDIHQLDLIYDHVLGCYYDPNTEIYYELKEK